MPVIALNAFFDCLTEKKHKLPLSISTSFFLKMHGYINGANPFQVYQKIIESSDFELHDAVRTLEILHTSNIEKYFTEEYSKILFEKIQKAFFENHEFISRELKNDYNLIQLYYYLFLKSTFSKKYASPFINDLFQFYHENIFFYFNTEVKVVYLSLLRDNEDNFAKNIYQDKILSITLLELFFEFQKKPQSDFLKDYQQNLLKNKDFLNSIRYYNVAMKKFFLKNLLITQEIANEIIANTYEPYDSYQVSKILTVCTEKITIGKLLENSCFKNEDTNSLTIKIISGLKNPVIDINGSLLGEETYNIPASFIVKRLKELDKTEHGEINIKTIIRIFSCRSSALSVRDVMEFMNLLPQSELSPHNIKNVFYLKLLQINE